MSGEGRRGLGRGLSALLDEAETTGPPVRGADGGPREVAIDLVYRNPEQPRRSFRTEELDELAQSIRERGILQPILVRLRPGEKGEYQIIAGERRWRAAQRAGLRVIPILVREAGDLEGMEIALIENIQRADLSPLEEARGYEAMTGRFSRSHEAIATMVGKSRSHVTNTVRLLRLPAAVQEHVEAGRLSAGHARTLIDVAGAEALAEKIIARRLTVRQAEMLAREGGKKGAASARTRARAGVDADTRALENDLTEVLGFKVEIRDKDGAGEIRIRYASLEQLDDLCRRLTRPGS